MERLYGEVKDEIDFSEPSYTVLRGKTAISPFGERSRCKEEKQEETDIRKKYSHASENNIKNKNKLIMLREYGKIQIMLCSRLT